MLFRTLAKDEFCKMISIILETDEVIGPKRIAAAPGRSATRHQFLPVQSFDEIELDYETTEYSAKTYFLPFRETLSTFRFENGDWTQEIQYRIQPRAMVGLHACDINALLRLDKVFLRDRFPSPYYMSRRKNTAIIGIDHFPSERCFCRSVGADAVDRGFDLYLTDLGERYFVAIGSDRGYGMIQRVESRAVHTEDTKAYLAVRRAIAGAFRTHVDIRNLPAILDIEFDSPVWSRWGGKCLSCGNCAMVCPSCYCYGVSERLSVDYRSAQKTKRLHACTLVDFAEVAGGHNFRPARESRLKYRYYHQHRGFVEAYDEPKCVGCNRCGRSCLAGISPPAVIRDLQEDERP